MGFGAQIDFLRVSSQKLADFLPKVGEDASEIRLNLPQSGAKNIHAPKPHSYNLAPTETGCAGLFGYCMSRQSAGHPRTFSATCCLG
jgi:hypothetical protein